MLRERKWNVFEIKFLISLVGVSRMKIVRNEEVRTRARIEKDFESCVDRRAVEMVLAHVRMDEYTAWLEGC